MTMWTYLLLCCLAAGTVSSSDSSSDSRPASSSTRSNSSLAATSHTLATGLKSFTDNFPKPACSLQQRNAVTRFSDLLIYPPSFLTIMVQATCSCCDLTAFEQGQVLIQVSHGHAIEFESKNLTIVLGSKHVFQFFESRGNKYDALFTFMHNNKVVDMESPQGVTVRDERRETVADLKLDRSGTAPVGYVEAQFPQHNITVGYAPRDLIIVHLDKTTYSPKQLTGFCGNALV